MQLQDCHFLKLLSHQMGVLASQKAGTRNQMGKRKGAGEQCLCTKSSWIIAIEKPEQYQKKWTELGFCWAEQEVPNFMNSYQGVSTGFLPQLAWRHWTWTKMEQQRQLLFLLLLSCLSQKRGLRLESAVGERRAEKCWPGELRLPAVGLGGSQRLLGLRQCRAQSTSSELGRTICWAMVAEMEVSGLYKMQA